MKSPTERSYRWLLWILALTGSGLDQVSKYGVFRWLYDPAATVSHTHPGYQVAGRAWGRFDWCYDGRSLRMLQGECNIVPGAFKLLTQFTGERETGTGVLTTLRTWSGDVLPKVNNGALFGLGSTYAYLANTIFAVVSVVAALAIVYWSTRRSTARDLSLCAALGLILAGTLGNLYDRIVFHGVRDFMYFHLIDWPVFNLADCCLVCGAFLLLAQAFLTRTAVNENDAPHTAQTPREMAEAG